MCGIVGIIKSSAVNQSIYDALTMIQHRGQDAAGMMTSDGKRVYLRKGNGLVREVVRKKHMLHLQGNIGIGHVRYPTAGSSSNAEAQPIYVNFPQGLAIAHNGNLVNANALRKKLTQEEARHLNTNSDSEILLNIFATSLQKALKSKLLTPEAIFQAVKSVQKQCQGAYAVIILIVGYGIIAFKDPYGIRPLIYGKQSTSNGHTTSSYMVASESVALSALDFSTIRDIEPGEAVIITNQGNIYQQICHAMQKTPCIFEYIYLARPDSVIDQVSVYESRFRMGKKLAKQLKKESFYHNIDSIIPIPDTSRVAAIALANDLNIPYVEGFIKNRYIGRTFIMTGQMLRKKSVKQKMNPIKSQFEGKHVLLVDDSIVRGTTSAEVIAMARKAGAKKVYFASVSPQVIYPNIYGIDMPSSDELIAHNKKTEEIAKSIGADGLIYQTEFDLYQAIKECNPHLNQFENSIFTGHYISGKITKTYLQDIEKKRLNKKKSILNSLADGTIVEIYNPRD